MDSKPDQMPLVFVIADDPSVRESVEQLAASAGWRAKAYECAAEFLASPAARVPSCLVLDIHLPDICGLEMQERVTRDRVELPVVFVAGQSDVPTAVRAMKAGAVDFLTKPCDEGPLLQAITSAIERSRTALWNESQVRELKERYATLTPRERQVMAGVTKGLLNKQVGFELGISEITVKAHRGKVMEKMGARSLPGLVEMTARLAAQISMATRIACSSVHDRPSAQARSNAASSFNAPRASAM
ncbi:MAG TPA: response regulator [Usitatibacter sp.]|nr:response regulator [Usitatibacter sp.]